MARVVVVSSVHPTFDTRVYHNQAVSLARGGHEVTLMIGAPEDTVTEEYVNICALPQWRNRWHRLWVDILCLFRTLRIKGDVFHFHDPELLPVAVILQKVFGRKCVYDAHEYYAEAILYKHWIPLRWRRSVASCAERLEKLCAGLLAGVITVNDDMCERFRHYNHEVVSIFNYPRPEVFKALLTVDQNKVDRPTVIYLGAIGHERGLETLVAAMEHVTKLLPAARCVIVGQVELDEVDPSAVETLNRLVQNGSIELIGQVPFAQAVEWLGTATVAWLPWHSSPNNELGIPRKLLEYMAASLPVVASDMGYISTIVRDGQCGELVTPDDPRQHADAVVKMLKFPEIARQYGASGRQAFMQRYNWKSEERKLLEFYQRIVGA